MDYELCSHLGVELYSTNVMFDYDDDQINRDEDFLKDVRSNDSEDKKLVKIQKHLSEGANVNFQNANRRNIAALHVAISKTEIRVIKLLVERGGNMHLRNDQNETPLELAERLKMPDIVAILKHSQKSIIGNQVEPDSSGNVIQDTDHLKEVDKRLIKFVKSVVEIYQEKLSEFLDEIKPGHKMPKAGKIAESIAQASGVASAIPVLGKLIRPALSKTSTFVGKRQHREKAKKISNSARTFSEDQEEQRKCLAEASFKIFRCFEKQFIQITDDDGNWERGIDKLAEDAVNRSLNYMYNKTNKDQIVCSEFIAEGVLLGKSKESLGATLLPAALQSYSNMPKPGRTVKCKQSGNTWNTSEMYERTGVMKVEGDITKYYKLKTESNSAKFGFRLLLDSENEKWDKELCQKYTSLESHSTEMYEYVANSLNMDEKIKSMCDEFDKYDLFEMAKRTENGIDRCNDRIDELQVGQVQLLKGQSDILAIGPADRTIWLDIRNSIRELENNNLEFRYYMSHFSRIEKDDREFGNSQFSHIERITFKRSVGVSIMCGQLYEMKLSRLILLEAIRQKEDSKIDSFYLATNMVDAGYFDDVVFRYSYRNQLGEENTRIIFLQVRHRDNPKNLITLQKLHSGLGTDQLDLKMFFTSYRKIKKQFSQAKPVGPIFHGKFENLYCDFILYTNAMSKLDRHPEIFEKIYLTADHILKYCGKESNAYYYRFIDNETNVKAAMDYLTESSDCKMLAQKLANYISSGMMINQNADIFRVFSYSLANQVFTTNELGEGIFRDSFLQGGEDCQFRSAFFEEMQKIKQFQSIDEVKVELSSTVIKLPNRFGIAKNKKMSSKLPCDLVTESEVKEFFSKFKLFVDQPDVSELEAITKQEMGLIRSMTLKNVSQIYLDVQNMFEKWWLNGNYYFTDSLPLFH